MQDLRAEVIRILTLLKDTNPNIVPALRTEGKSFLLSTVNKTLLQISADALKLLGKRDVSTKLEPSQSSDERASLDDTKLRTFFEALSESVVRLNHLGISYACASIEEEANEYVTLLKDSGLQLYQEPAQSKYERWFFIGDRARWEQPLFEVVLTQSEKPLTDVWVPHFQIDLDTTLGIAELKALTEKHLGKDFFKWIFDIPGYGAVLATGRLANIGGTKIYLALGTNLRGTEWHRTQGLKDYEPGSV